MTYSVPGPPGHPDPSGAGPDARQATLGSLAWYSARAF